MAGKVVMGKGSVRRGDFFWEDRFYEALAELGRNDGNATIYRLAQSVINGKMPQELFSTMTVA